MIGSAFVKNLNANNASASFGSSHQLVKQRDVQTLDVYDL